MKYAVEGIKGVASIPGEGRYESFLIDGIELISIGIHQSALEASMYHDVAFIKRFGTGRPEALNFPAFCQLIDEANAELQGVN